jgi:hypothetical protein
VRTLTLLAAGATVALGLASQTGTTAVPLPALNQRIMEFCQKSMGRKVGDGECADLAYKAMLASGAESPDYYKDDPKPGDYVWGDLVYGRKIQGRDQLEKGERLDVKPGDIIQMRDLIIEHEEVTDEYVSREVIDADHHTAIVSGLSDDGLTYDVIEQNANEVPTVTTGKLRIGEMKRGYILVYRAVPGLSGDRNVDGQARYRAGAQTREWKKARR